jgi:hypothetical protein
LSKFDYTYSATGDILTWRQQADVNAVQWSYVYDTAGQLLGAEKWSTDVTPALLKRYAYTYDAAGNRTAEQIDDLIVGATFDPLNRSLSQQPSGPLTFAGTTNEPASVTESGAEHAGQWISREAAGDFWHEHGDGASDRSLRQHGQSGIRGGQLRLGAIVHIRREREHDVRRDTHVRVGCSESARSRDRRHRTK